MKEVIIMKNYKNILNFFVIASQRRSNLKHTGLRRPLRFAQGFGSLAPRNDILLGAFVLVILFASSQVFAVPTNSDYTASPPFTATSIEPNVLIVLDNSGSMCDQAYAGSYDPSGFTNGLYYGYFDGSKNYKYTSNGRWEETTAALTTGTTANPIASGSFLNWATMRRVEVAKKLLIGGKAAPRSPNADITVKLNAETACSSSWDFSKDYDTTGQDLIYPFAGNYRFTSSGGTLSVSPIGGGTNTFYTYPTSDTSVPAGWSEFPTGGAVTAWDKVDEAASDSDTTYIKNNNTTSPVMLAYNYTQAEPAGTITVTVKVRAKKTASSGGTRSIAGVIRIDGVDYEANTSAISTSYSLYSFTWTTNPATSAAWTWDQIKAIAGSGNLQGFGVKAAANYASSFPYLTQVYLDVSVTTPSGGPYNTIVDQGMVKAEGIIDTLGDEARFGLAFYNNGRNSSEGCSGGGCEDGAYVDNNIAFSTATNMITSIHNMTPSTWTPLAETLYEMVRYFRQDSPYYSNAPADYQTGLNYDPYYFDYPASSSNSDQYVPCAKSFILFLTDGESTQDTNIPAEIRGYSSGYRFAGTTVGTTYGSNGRDYMIDVAFWARTNDMRPGACTTTPTSFDQCLLGTQNVILYPVFMFGRGSTLLKDAAITGGFKDLNTANNIPDCTTTPEECYRDSDGDGVVRSDGSDLPLTYFEGDDGYALEENITSAIRDILKRVASGTSVSVISTSASGAGDIYQCYFLPVKTIDNNDVTWLGHLLQLGVNETGELLDNTGSTITFSFDENEGQTYINKGGNKYALTEWTGYKWDAGEELVTKTPASRTIKTFVDADNDGAVDSGEFISFDDGNKTTLKPYLRAADDAESANIINFTRGSSISGYRNRTYSGTDQYKLGDIIYSTPTVVTSPAENYGLLYGDKTYSTFFDANKSRDTVVYIGANDGMLHAFCAEDSGCDNGAAKGKELWAYIPQNLLPHLKWLTDSNYSHVYYVDLRAKVTDINFSNAGTNGWKTVLIGGMRLGGGQISVTDDFGNGSETRTFQSSYFAIDITDPHNPSLLWEFTLSDASLGFTTSYPTIAKVGNKWFVIIGSGSKSAYTPDYTGASTQSGKIFILDARNTTGAWTLNSTYWVKDTNDILSPDINTAFMGDPLAVDIDFKSNNTSTDSSETFNTEVVYIGMTYGTSPNWKGKLFRLVLNGDVNPANWIPNTLFDGDSFATATPITTSPVATKDELDNLWVYFGTGRFYTNTDKTTSTAHTFLGIRDSYWETSQWKPCWNGTSWSTNTQCTTSGITATSSLYNSGDVTSVVEGGSSGTVVNSTTYGSNKPWNDFVQNVTTSSTIRGWYNNFTAGTTDVGAERVIAKPAVIGGNLLFTTFIPKTDLCSYGGTSNLYSLYYKTGTAYKESTLETPTTAQLAAGYAVAKSISLGYGMASSPAVHIGQQEGGTATVFVQDSTGRINSINYNLELPKSGVISWQEL